MGDYIKETFERMNLHQFRSFILYGTDDFAEEVQPYRDTLKKGCDPIYKRLDRLTPTKQNGMKQPPTSPKPSVLTNMFTWS